MALPARHHSKHRRNSRRSHLAKSPVALTLCPKCHYPIKPHRVCSNCGEYKGKVVIDVFKKLNKKEKRAKAEELKNKNK